MAKNTVKIPMKMMFPLSDIPVYDPKIKDTELQVVKALNWFNLGSTNNREKKWAMEYLDANKTSFKKEDLDILKSADANMFERVGRYCAMSMKGFPENDWHKKHLETSFNQIIKTMNLRKAAMSASAKTRANVQDFMREKADEAVGSLLSIIDDFILVVSSMKKSKDSEFFDAAAWLKRNEIKPMISRKMVSPITEIRKEFDAVLTTTDDQLKEGYSHLRETHIKRIIRFIDSILDVLNQESAKKPVRVGRKRKAKAPSKVVEKVKYCSEISEYGGVKSVHPTKILGAKSVVVFNTKYREFTIYEATNDKDGLGIKGTTIQGFDVTKSKSKRVREIYLDDLFKTAKSQGIRATRNQFNGIRAKESTPTGRLNDNCVIVRVF